VVLWVAEVHFARDHLSMATSRIETGELPKHLDRRDVDVVAPMSDVVRVFVNDSRWWQNASFALPFLGFVLSAGVGWLFGSAEALGFGLFLGFVTAIMAPVVLLTWRGTATSISLCEDRAVALHHGTVLHEVPWAVLHRIERVEYLGNVRHKLIHGEDEFMTVESEIEQADELVELAFELSGVARQVDGPLSEGTPRA
jgi:hypothetical protein